MNSRSSHSINTVFVLMIFCLFAVCSLFLVLIGANSYRRIVGEMDSNNETRASLSYISNKVHAANGGDVGIETLNGQKVLVIGSNTGERKYNTYIYLYNGYLMELFTRADNGFTPGDGDKITPLTAFTMEKDGSELILSVCGQNRQSLSLNLFLS